MTKYLKIYSRVICTIIITLTITHQSHAAFLLVDDFSSLTPGSSLLGSTASNGNTWSNATPGFGTGDNLGLNESGNIVLANDPVTANGTSGPYISLSNNILTDTQSTFFFRVNIQDTSTKNVQFSLADSSAPTNQGDAKTIATNFQGSGATTTLGLQNGSGASVNLSQNTWYNIWLEIDTNTNTYDGFVQGGAFASRTTIDTGATFRAYSDGTPLQSVLSRANSSHQGEIWFDDLYVDTTGFNTANPIPEPSTYALILIGFVSLLFLKRKA